MRDYISLASTQAALLPVLSLAKHRSLACPLSYFFSFLFSEKRIRRALPTNTLAIDPRQLFAYAGGAELYFYACEFFLAHA